MSVGDSEIKSDWIPCAGGPQDGALVVDESMDDIYFNPSTLKMMIANFAHHYKIGRDGKSYDYCGVVHRTEIPEVED